MGGLIGLGVMFGLRSAVQVIGQPFAPVYEFDADALYYLANSPAVLFAAMVLPILALQKMRTGFVVSCVLLALACVPLLAMVVTLQRASLGALILYALILSAISFYRAPRKTLVSLGLGAVLLLPFLSEAQDVFQGFSHKTSLHGFNMRFEELGAIWLEISKNGLTLVFGKGWGGEFSSPAVADIRVNYTHSLLSAMLLKTGLLGLVLTFFYLFGLARLCLALLGAWPWIALAITAPVLIDVFLYASYKSLDFGLVLTLVPAAILYRQKVASVQEKVYSQ
jgi:hypothetical protein